MDFWLDIMKVGTLLNLQTKLIAMTTNYIGVWLSIIDEPYFRWAISQNAELKTASIGYQHTTVYFV